MPKKQTSTTKQTSLFDIRLKNLDHDVLVLKGGELEAGSALLAGKIVLSVNEPLTVKKMSLRLYSTMRLNWVDTYQTTKGTFPKPVKFEKKVYEYHWDSADINSYLNNLYENSAHSNSSVGLNKTPSTTSLKNLGSLRSKSSSSLSSLHLSSLQGSLGGSSSNLQGRNNHVLVQGNYEIPFRTILPGNIPESVEGLPGGSVVYKLEATIDRGKFHNSMVTKKHLRVIRTLTTDAVELSETVAVDNTWPKKVEYSLNVPSKAIAIGGGTSISFMLVPLLKGLRLGDIKIQLVEYYSFNGYLGIPHNEERIVSEKSIAKPKDNDPRFQMDKWEIDTYLKVPVSLSKCTQDCDIQNHLKVRHKLKFVIGLVNPDNHVSELRASLPVQLFISPFVSISARYDDAISESNSINGDVHPEDEEEEILFTSDLHSASNTSLNQAADNEQATNINSATSFNELMAPPLYEKHVYDRLWSDVSPVESPIASGAVSPRYHGRGHMDVQNHFSMSPIDSVQLTENLRQLSFQRQLQESSEASTPSTPGFSRERTANRAVFNFDGDDTGSTSDTQGDYFTRGRPIQQQPQGGASLPLLSPGVLSPPHHLSRVGSESSLLNSGTLSKVPSYNQAIRSEVQDEVLSPAYQPPLPGSNINLVELNKRFEEMNSQNSSSTSLSRNRSFLSKGGSMNLMKSSRNSSAGSSPSQSRNVSSTNLAALSSSQPSKRVSNSSSPSSSSSNIAGLSKGPVQFSMTPVSPPPAHNNHKPQENPTHSSISISQPSVSASNRSAAVNVPLRSSSSLSLHNLQFLNKKKDKK